MKTAMIYRADFKTKANGYHMDAGAEIFKALGQDGADAVMVAAMSTTLMRDLMANEMIRSGVDSALEELVYAVMSVNASLAKKLPQDQQTAWKRIAERIDKFRIELKKKI